MAILNEAAREELEGESELELSRRALLMDSIALAYATGIRPAQLCEQFNYTYAAMQNLLSSDDMLVRIGRASQQLQSQVAFAHSLIALRLPDILRIEMEVATTGDVRDKVSQVARHWLVDKVMPTSKVILTETTHSVGGVLGEATGEIRSLLSNLNEAARTRRSNILDSPHVKRGRDALPAPPVALPVAPPDDNPNT